MPRAKSLSRTVLVNMLLTSIVAVGVLGVLWVAGEYRQFRGEAGRLRELLLRERRTLISTHVEDTVRYVQYMRARTEQRARDGVRTQVLEAYAVASQLAERFADRPREEVAGGRRHGCAAVHHSSIGPWRRYRFSFRNQVPEWSSRHYGWCTGGQGRRRQMARSATSEKVSRQHPFSV